MIPYSPKSPFDTYIDINLPPAATKYSRRVIINNLPRGASITQTLKGVRGVGGIIRAAVFDTSKIEGQGERSASIEFTYPSSAAAFVQSANTNRPLVYKDLQNSFAAEVWLAPSQSDRLRREDSALLSQGYTRCFKAEGFPVGAVWFLISVLGQDKITHSHYDDVSESLTLEFVSIFEVAKAHRLLLQHQFPFYHPHNPLVMNWATENKWQSISPQCDNTDGDISELPRERRVITHVSSCHLDMTFNRYPYNTKWPDYYHPVMYLQHLTPRNEELDRQMYKSEVCSIAEGLKLSRNKWSWEDVSAYDASDEASSSTESIINSIKNPRLGRAWSDFFQENQENTIDLQRWERYSAIAAHRRELCAQQGLQEGQIPQCREVCGLDCASIHSTPVSKVIKDYLEREE